MSRTGCGPLAAALAAVVAAGLAASVAISAPASPAPSPPGAAVAELALDSLAGRYQRPGADLGTLRQGPFTVHLASPDNVLELLTAGLELEPLGDGTHRARVRVAIRGEGRLEAELDLGGEPARLADAVTVPEQSLTVESRLRLAADDGAYEITPLELPAVLQVRIESALLGRLAATCRPLALLALTPVDCAGVERALSVAAVPLPEPGVTYLLARERLDEGERRALDAYLAEHAPAASQQEPAP